MPRFAPSVRLGAGVRRLTVVIALLGASAVCAGAILTLEWTIPLTGVSGRIDHFAIDGTGRRLFVAALGNNSVEVVDLVAGKARKPITSGLAEPQGICFVGEYNRLYVANGGDGAVRIFDGRTLAPAGAVQFDGDADNLRYDAAAKLLYVGHGRGALGAIDVTMNRVAFDVPLQGHPESFQLEPRGSRIFINVPGAHQVAVVDPTAKRVIATWPVDAAADNFPLALDGAGHRLFLGCRTPARLLVFDTQSGREVAKLALHGDCDDLFFDPAWQGLYASCGEGYIDVFTASDADPVALKEAIRTEAKARTCFVDGDQLYLAVPKRGKRPAEVRCYRIAQ